MRPDAALDPVSPAQSSTPRWVIALLILQGATLMVALGGLPQAAPAEAGQQGRSVLSPQPEPRETVLPNAAAQRQEQINLLRRIAEELSGVNGRLDRMSRALEQQAERAPAGE